MSNQGYFFGAVLPEQQLDLINHLTLIFMQLSERDAALLIDVISIFGASADSAWRLANLLAEDKAKSDCENKKLKENQLIVNVNTHAHQD